MKNSIIKQIFISNLDFILFNILSKKVTKGRHK